MELILIILEFMSDPFVIIMQANLFRVAGLTEEGVLRVEEYFTQVQIKEEVLREEGYFIQLIPEEEVQIWFKEYFNLYFQEVEDPKVQQIYLIQLN